ncbi:MAG TPA: aminotransferase class I/II-fold pyridoxal phosphate-dependent enzyme [Chloroflexia bacterium]|nr:aminotransferase class I/II-fold pyridoxal phosphate-dependent enzyme [Chloroflexia bacterium]
MQIPPFKLERYFARYEFEAPYLLCSSDCESMTVQELLQYEPEAASALQQLWLGYTESAGNPQLRQEITRLYETIAPEEILVHTGAEEAIFTFMNAALQPGDHIIVHWPCYQSLEEVAISLGCAVTRWETREEEGWELNLDFLRQSIRANTRAVVVNCPHNPTGYQMSQDKQSQLIEIVRENNLWLFSDEVYRYLEYREEDRLPAAADLYEKAVSLGVMSKTFGLPGLRIGWIASHDREIYRRMADFKDYTTICNSAPSEILATIALRHFEEIAERNRRITTANLQLLNQFFATYSESFNWQPPKAGAIAFPSLRLNRSIEDFCRDLVEKKGVLLLPGNLFDYSNKNFRLGFGRRNMAQGLQRLEEFIRENL